MANVLCIILNYKTPEMTVQSVTAALVAMQDVEGMIVVVDNASGDGSFEALKTAVIDEGWPVERVHVVQSGHNGGFGAGNNFGIQYGARQYGAMPGRGAPEYVYILNSDAFVDRDAITQLITHFEGHEDCGLACSQLYEEGVPAVHSAFRFPSIASELEGAARFGPISRLLAGKTVPLPIPEQTSEVDWGAGASMMIRYDVLQQIGLFDEAYFLYFEETDLCLRARRAGWRTHYVVESRVLHIGSVSTGMRSWARMPGYWFDSRLRYFTSNHGAGYAALASLAHLGGGILARLRGLVQPSKRSGQDAKWFLRDLVMHYVKTIMTGRKITIRKVP
jgi:GT2 family glycosyltransferase